MNSEQPWQSAPTQARWLLQACIFVTGLSGIVAEYVMATLASYLLGNAVLQWTLVLSLMLFAMGLGARISRVLQRHLLDAFIIAEFVLAVVSAVSALAIYFLSAYLDAIGSLIYAVAIAIGLLVGLEIPLVTRLNELFEELRVNISVVMERDYYGALLGGLLFAFVGLPFLGLTYTPIVLGGANLLMATVLLWRLQAYVHWRKPLLLMSVLLPLMLLGLALLAKPIMLFGEQRKYTDKIILEQQSRYQRIVVTEWKGDYWLYLNANIQFSTVDEHRYHEPLVHPAMQAAAARTHVLILGGGDGLAAREVLHHADVQSLTLVDLDPAMTALGRDHPLFQTLNKQALQDERVRIHNVDAHQFLRDTTQRFDVIIIDLPDPKTVGLARLYSREFYQLASQQLNVGGTLVTQASSPFFSRHAYLSILRSMRAAGLSAVAMHNHVPTMGEWGWVIGQKGPATTAAFHQRLLSLQYSHLPTRFLNQQAMSAMLHFGKPMMMGLDKIKVTTEADLAVYHYYAQGRWDLY